MKTDDNIADSAAHYEALFLEMLRGDISQGEYDELETWFMESPDNRDALTEMYRAHYALTVAERGANADPAGALRRLNDTLRARRNRRRLRLTAGAAAAAIVVAVGIFSTLNNRDDKEAMQEVAQNDGGAELVKLIFSDNRTLTFDGKEPAIEYGDVIADDKPQSGRGDDGTDAGAKVQLIVPKGKRTNMTLPDGTVMWVNSDSHLEFPSRFGALREIDVDGEVYLNVARDEKKPFVVHTANFDVTVLGTSFNVNAYGRNDAQSVTLLDGSVNVATADKSSTTLAPSQMLTYAGAGVTVERVDPADHVSWITGVYRFNSARLKEIAERLVNYYGKPVVFASDELAARRFSGRLEFSELADFVYESLAIAASLEYTDHGDRIEFRESTK